MAMTSLLTKEMMNLLMMDMVVMVLIIGCVIVILVLMMTCPYLAVKLMLELQGQKNIGVFDVETCKLASLLMFRESASAFWPPPTWFKNNQNESY
ncbi:hypothetical protein LIER_39766 [Lithospermum erythrorhizon]|uniref:Transmembrane protein n=1 Tax=Lithospermum erythrorhizon TaxID=34254 RepID=A0AAV3QL02_LITER